MSGMQIRAFRPFGNNQTVNITTTAASQNLAFPARNGTNAVRIVNLGTDPSFIEFAQVAGVTAAAATSIPLLPNSAEVFTLANDVVGLRVVGAAGGSVLYVTVGEGL